MRRNKIRISFYTIWSIGFFIICFISSLWAPDPSYSLKVARGFLEIAIIGCLFLSLEKDKSKVEFYQLAILVSGIFLVLRVLVEFPITSWGITRLHNENLNANSIGMLLMLSGFCAYHMYKMTNKKIFLLILLFYNVIILFTGSKKAFFGIVFGIVFLWWLHVNKKSKRTFAIPIAFASIIILIILVLKVPTLYNIIGYRVEGFLNIFSNNSKIDKSTIIRSQMINVGWEMFKERPIFGHGLYAFESLSGFNTYAHNNYIELLTSVGLIGFSWYYLIYMYNIIKIFKLIKLKDKQVKIFACFFVIQILLEFAYVSWQSESTHIFIIFSTKYIENRLRTLKTINYNDSNIQKKVNSIDLSTQ